MEDDDSLKHELLAIGRISTAKATSESVMEGVPLELEPIPSKVLEELTRKYQTAPQKAYLLQLLEDSGREDTEENLRFIENVYGDISTVEMTSIQKEAMWDKFLLSVFSTYVGKAVELLGLDQNRIGDGPKAALEFQNKSKEIIEGFIQPIVTEWRAYHPLATTADTAVFFITMITGLTPGDASRVYRREAESARESRDDNEWSAQRKVRGRG
jgi:hypothetical protein